MTPLNTKRPKVFLISLLALICAATLLLPSCQQAPGPAQTQPPQGTGAQLTVISTVFASYDFAKQIAGPHAQVKMLIPPGTEIHSFEPSPQDILDIQHCDLFIYVGGDSDAWVTNLLSSIDLSSTTVLKLMDCVTLTQEDPTVLADHTPDDNDKPESDEHVWTSLANAKSITQEISGALIALDAANTADYEANTAAYLAQLDELDAQYLQVVQTAKRHVLVFADRYPFQYLAKEYGLTCYAAFPGCSTATEPSAQTVIKLVDLVREQQIPAVFYLELSNHKLADVIAQETNTQALLLHSCHNISLQDYQDGASYVSIMGQNLKNLKVALN